MKERVYYRVDGFRRLVLLKKSAAAWKKYSYRVRVQNYLENKFKLRFGERFFSCLREKYFAMKTLQLMEKKADSQFAQTLLVKSLVSLRVRA